MTAVNINLLEEVLNEKINDNEQKKIIIDLIKTKKNDKNNDKCNLSKIKKILGEDFKYNWIFGENENKLNVFCFEFINKSKISNRAKSIFINQKIEQLVNNGFFEVEDLKISGRGRFLVIRIKTIEEYEDEKKLLEKEYYKKIELIDKKINVIKNNK